MKRRLIFRPTMFTWILSMAALLGVAVGVWGLVNG